MHPLIVSYFTPGTAYEAHAKKLRASADRLKLEHRIEARPARPTWVENCAQKALFIQEIRQEVDRPILWIDADATLNRRVHELENCTADIAIVKRHGWSFYGGQIFFGSGEGADRIVNLWADYCRNWPNIWDQVSLGYAWWDAALTGEVSAVWLEKSFFQKRQANVFSRLKQIVRGTEAAVIHKQESRKSKTAQGQPDYEEFANWHIPEWWREAAIQNAPFPLRDDQRVELGLRVR